MNTFICEDVTALGPAASSWCAKKIAALNARSIFVPAGNTPISLYKTWEREKPAYLNGLDLIQVDDVLTGAREGMFKSFFETHLPSYKQQLRWVGDGSQVADLAILGVGLNGHVAFHEPGLGLDFFSGCVRLSQITCESLSLEPGAWGVSYGVGAFMQSKAILLMISGASKRDVLNRLLRADSSLPASALLRHPNLSVIADREAIGVAAPEPSRRFPKQDRQPEA